MICCDVFIEWFGLQVDEIGSGYCWLYYMVCLEFVNGFDSIYGGIFFLVVDLVFVFVCNLYGIISVVLDVIIIFICLVKFGEILIVEVKELYFGNKIGLYDICIMNEVGELVVMFKGIFYRIGKEVK